MNVRALAVSKPVVAIAALLTIGGGAGITAIASAQTTTPSTSTGTTASAVAANHARMPGVFGKITAISGDTVTITSQGFGKNATATTYTVDASNAAITVGQKGSAGAAGTISSLAVGDEIGVQGTVSGTNVTATKIMSGMMGGRGFGFGGQGGRGANGTVTAINGNTITITGDNGTTYTVDASGATVSKVVDETVGNIVVGDRIGAQGSVSGTAVVATHIMDGIPAKPAGAPTQQ